MLLRVLCSYNLYSLRTAEHEPKRVSGIRCLVTAVVFDAYSLVSVCVRACITG